jgi:NADH-quinone oxidoreductase subunit N
MIAAHYGSLTILKIISYLDVIYFFAGFLLLSVSVGYLTHIKIASPKMFVGLTLYMGVFLAILIGKNPIRNISIIAEPFLQLFMLFAGTFLIILYAYIKQGVPTQTGFITLIHLALLGMFLIFFSEDLFFWFLAIELQSFAFYALASFQTNRINMQSEAGLKYFVFGAIASSVLLYGLSLIYTEFGTLQIAEIESVILLSSADTLLIPKIGFALVLIALFIKAGCAPFHLWTPQVYSGAAPIVTFLFLLLPKIPLFYILYTLSSLEIVNAQELTALILVASLIIGSLYAFSSSTFRTFMAYSAISNNGFLLAPLLSTSAFSLKALTTFLLMYNIVITLIFCVVLFLKRYDNTPIIQNLRDLSLLKKANLMLAISIALAFLNFSGIPPLFGFFAKILVLTSTLSQASYTINIALLAVSVLAVYYYIRILKTLFFTFTLKFVGAQSMPQIPSVIIALCVAINVLYILQPVLPGITTFDLDHLCFLYNTEILIPYDASPERTVRFLQEHLGRSARLYPEYSEAAV